VCGSSATRRPFLVLVGFSFSPALVWAMLSGTHRVARSRSTFVQPSAHSSPRRVPVIMVSQSRKPHSGVGPRLVEQRGGLVGAGWVRLGRGRRGGLGQGRPCSRRGVPSARPDREPRRSKRDRCIGPRMLRRSVGRSSHTGYPAATADHFHTTIARRAFGYNVRNERTAATS